MKAATAAAILAYCASQSSAAPVEKRDADAEAFLSNLKSLIPFDFKNRNPNDDSPFNPFDDPHNIGKRDAEADAFFNLGGGSFQLKTPNPTGDSPFNPFDKRNAEADAFFNLGGGSFQLKTPNPTGDSPFNPFDKRNAEAEPFFNLGGGSFQLKTPNPTGDSPFNPFDKRNAEAEAFDFKKLLPFELDNPNKDDWFNPVDKRNAEADPFFNLGGASFGLKTPNPTGDSPFNPFDKRAPGERTAALLKRYAEADPNIFKKIAKGIGKALDKIPGVREFGHFVPGFNGLRNIVDITNHVSRRDAAPSDEEVAAALHILKRSAEADPFSFGKLFKSIRNFPVIRGAIDQFVKREAEADPEAFFKDLVNSVPDLSFFGGFGNIPGISAFETGKKILNGKLGKNEKREAEADPEAFLKDLVNKVPDLSFFGGFGNIPGISAFETGKKILNGKLGKNEKREAEAEAEADPEALFGALSSAQKLKVFDRFQNIQQIPKILEGLFKRDALAEPEALFGALSSAQKLKVFDRFQNIQQIPKILEGLDIFKRDALADPEALFGALSSAQKLKVFDRFQNIQQVPKILEGLGIFRRSDEAKRAVKFTA